MIRDFPLGNFIFITASVLFMKVSMYVCQNQVDA